MSGKRILVVEDDITTAMMLHEFLLSRGFSAETASNGNEAIEKYNRNPAQVVITDLNMPVMDGNELIEHLNGYEPAPVIFVTTGNRTPELIIEIMKKGVYDYIIKPVDMSDLLLKLTRAFEAFNLKRVYEIAQKEKIIRLENALEWYRFEERVMSRDMKSIGENIFNSLLASFTQGSGFGGLVTLTALMKSTAVKEGDYYKLKSELFEMIMQNVSSAEKALQTFGDIIKITSGLHEPEIISMARLYDEISNTIRDLHPQIMIKKHHLSVSDKKNFFNDQYIEINLNYFIKAIEEIIINSLKFSPAGSDIMILFLKQNEECSISVINDVTVNDSSHNGIPTGYENLVFEPFFRLTRTVHDQYKTLDYGLGLTLAEKIINAYRGIISIHNINDYSDMKGGIKTRVECRITFPAAVRNSVKR